MVKTEGPVGSSWASFTEASIEARIDDAFGEGSRLERGGGDNGRGIWDLRLMLERTCEVVEERPVYGDHGAAKLCCRREWVWTRSLDFIVVDGDWVWT